MADLRASFLEGMSHAASTVSIVTTDGAAGRAGVTVSAMTSVSADTDRPTLLVCIHHLSRVAPALLENRVFCVSVLKNDQAHVSDAFAGRQLPPDGDKFSVCDWAVGNTGAPRVAQSLVAFDCRLADHRRVGTHHVVFGEVVEVFVAPSGSPLIYANRAYGIPAGASARAPLLPSAGTLRLGCYHTFAPFLVPQALAALAGEGSPVDLELVEGDQERLLAALEGRYVDVSVMYDVAGRAGLATEVLGNANPYVLLPGRHPLAGRAAVDPADLADEPLILLHTHPTEAFVRRVLDAAGVQPNVRYRAQSLEVVRGMVGQGLGYAILATRPAGDMTYDGHALSVAPLAAPDMPGSEVVLVRRADAALQGATARFAEVCRRIFGAG